MWGSIRARFSNIQAVLYYFFPNEASALLHLVSLVGFNPTVASFDLGAPKVSYTLQAPSM
jgi:hypothetical protein